MTKKINIDPFGLIPEDSRNALLKPPLTAIGETLGTLLSAGSHSLFDGFRKKNIVREQDLQDFKERISNHIEDIPQEHRSASKRGLILKAIDDSKYRLNEKYMREAFARLISDGLDDRTNQDLYPAYSEILANMSSDEAILLLKIRNNLDQVPTIVVRQKDFATGGYDEMSARILIFFDETVVNGTYTLATDLLKKSALINIVEKSQLLDPRYAKGYDDFEKSETLERFKRRRPTEPGYYYSISRGFLELTDLGIAFSKFISSN